MSAYGEYLDYLDQSMLDLYNEYVMQGTSAWEGFQGNEGQMAIVQRHVLPAAAQHVQAAKELWPTGQSPEDYLDALIGSHEAAEQALGETIYQAYENLMELWEPAESLMSEHDSLSSAGPHSTTGVWR